MTLFNKEECSTIIEFLCTGKKKKKCVIQLKSNVAEYTNVLFTSIYFGDSIIFNIVLNCPKFNIRSNLTLPKSPMSRSQHKCLF